MGTKRSSPHHRWTFDQSSAPRLVAQLLEQGHGRGSAGQRNVCHSPVIHRGRQAPLRRAATTRARPRLHRPLRRAAVPPCQPLTNLTARIRAPSKIRSNPGESSASAMKGVSSNGSSWPARRDTCAPFQSAVASRWSAWRVIRARTVRARSRGLDVDADERARGALRAVERRCAQGAAPPRSRACRCGTRHAGTRRRPVRASAAEPSPNRGAPRASPGRRQPSRRAASRLASRHRCARCWMWSSSSSSSGWSNIAASSSRHRVSRSQPMSVTDDRRWRPRSRGRPSACRRPR